MSVPWQVSDGDFSVLTQIGTPTWVLPFQDKGDTQSFELHAKYRIAASNYAPLRNPRILSGGTVEKPTFTEQMQQRATARGIAYLVSESETSDVGGGILELTRIYASIPVIRFEGASIPFSLQFLYVSAGLDDAGTPTIAEFPLTFSGRYKYEYSLSQPQVLFAPRLAIVNGEIKSVGVYADASPTAEFAAADSEIGIYKGGIFYRKTALVKSGSIGTRSTI